jgi:hypothetical protein
MKKILTLIFVLAFVNVCFSQDCELDRNFDKFENETKINTRRNGLAKCIKYIKGNTSVYYLALNCKGLTVSVSTTGVKVLLKNGKSLVFNSAEIDVEPGEDGWFEYSAFIRLSPAQLNLLASSQITDFRLYVYDCTLTDDVGMEFIKDLKCLMVEK